MRSIILLLLLGCTFLPVPSSNMPTETVSRWMSAEEFIFFAVLEGLYRDGVSTQAAEAIAALDPETELPLNFVYACPLCTPALNAFRSYMRRPVFLGDKAGRDTFGSGLPKTTLEHVLASSRETRLDRLHELIQGWVKHRLEEFDLSPEERQSWGQHLANMREKGNAILASYQEKENPYFEHYKGWSRCAACDGSAEAGDWY